MPASESREIIPRLRESHPSAKIIVFSCYDVDFQKETIKGADGYFNKSEGFRELLAKIKTLNS